ncbi:hypothetical protein ACFLZ8_05010 [Planctomycetota bacterium]
MSPVMQTRGNKISIPDNIYTAILAVALCVVILTAAIVALKCLGQYETLFKIAT